MSENLIESSLEFLPLAVFLVSFFLGSIPFGLLVAKIFKVNHLLLSGSGNIGATNVSRIVGFWPAGVITFVLDLSKGVLATLLASPSGYRFLLEFLNANHSIPSVEFSHVTVWAAGLFAIVGHCYSPWLNFKGGKGVATGLGVALVLSPLAALGGIVGYTLVFLHRKISSLASLAGLGMTAVVYLVLNPIAVHLWVGLAMVFLILMRHEANIDALLENREKSF